MELKEFSLKEELWREYDFAGRIYRIDNPQILVYHDGGSTHKIVDSDGIVHCIPTPGYMGCVLRWKNKEGFPPVKF